MWILGAILFFCLGVLVGFQFPIWLDAWRKYQHQRTFKLTILQQFAPKIAQRLGRRGKSR